MISAIICSRDPAQFSQVERNLHFTAGIRELECIRIDNAQNQLGICAAYNLGASQARGDVLIFLHEDVFHLEMNWGPKLLSKFAQDRNLGIVGVAGTQILWADPPLWTRVGRPWLFGKVVHELDNGNRYFMTVFSSESGDHEVVAVDGCWMAVRKQVLASVQFDAETLPGFHFYDMDFCLQTRKHWKIIASTDILVKHRSGGSFNDNWRIAAERFRHKWFGELPACLPPLVAPDLPGGDFFNVDLKGKIPQVTLGT